LLIDSFPISFSSLQLSIVIFSIAIIDFTISFGELIYKCACELETFRVFQGANALPHSLNKITFIRCSIIPGVFPFTMWKALNIRALITVSIGKILFAPAMLQKVFEAAFIILAILAFMDAFAFHNPMFPLAHVTIAIG
jgi:hypothetical protein